MMNDRSEGCTPLASETGKWPLGCSSEEATRELSCSSLLSPSLPPSLLPPYVDPCALFFPGFILLTLCSPNEVRCTARLIGGDGQSLPEPVTMSTSLSPGAFQIVSMLRTSRAEDQVITPVIKGWLDWGLEDSHTANVPAHKCEHTLQYEDSRGQPRTAGDSGGQWRTGVLTWSIILNSCWFFSKSLGCSLSTGSLQQPIRASG